MHRRGPHRRVRPAPVWVAILLLIGLIALAMWQLSPGSRRIPVWVPLVAGAVLIGSAMLLERDERLAPLLLLAGGGAIASLRRVPIITTPAATVESGTPTPGNQTAAPAYVPEGTVQDTSALDSPAVIDLAPGRVRIIIPVIGALVTLLGVFTLWSTWFYTQDLATPGRVLGTLFGLLFLGLGIFLLAGGLAVRRGQRLTIDDRGIRRTGSGRAWDLQWSQIESIGVRVRERARNPMGGAGGFNRRRELTLLFTLGQHSPVGTEAMADTSLSPFDHQDSLPDLHPLDPISPTAVTLDRALRRHAPDRYLGVLQD